MRREDILGVPEPRKRSVPALPPTPSAPTSANPSPRRKVSIVVSVVASCLLLLGGGFLIYSAMRPDVDTSPSPEIAPPETSASKNPPSTFTASLLDVGWELHTAKNEEFSLALPPSWSPYIKDIPDSGPYLKFATSGYSYTRQGHPWLYVFKVPVDTWEVPETYFEQRRVRVYADPTAVRVSELTEIQLSDGVGYTFTSVSESPSGRISETLYGILYDGYEYTFVILVPLKHKHEYDFLFDDIAKTFEITD